MTINYCRRERSDGAPCGERIRAANALNWCEGCREAHLPFWPQDEALRLPASLVQVHDQAELF